MKRKTIVVAMDMAIYCHVGISFLVAFDDERRAEEFFRPPVLFVFFLVIAIRAFPLISAVQGQESLWSGHKLL